MTNKSTPYYAVIFTSQAKNLDSSYHDLANKMIDLASKQPGYIGLESAREEIGITVSYWKDLESIKNWKQNSEHLYAQEMGRKKFYSSYKVRIAKIEQEYSFH